MTVPSDRREQGGRDGPDAVHETGIGDRTASEAVIDATAALRDVEPRNLAALYETLDPDALDALCANSDDDADLAIQFDYGGLLVTIRPPDSLTIVEP